ncbi:MAG: hypothetical protein IPH58_10715 [Sphingobacteriales bacterium]|nr:hypothetical protein [Sphingobacteriales bacterium]
MKNIVIFKYVLTALVIFFITNSIFAQRKSPRSAYDTKPASAYDKKAPAANNTKSAPAKKTSTAKKGEVVTNTDSASSSYNNKLPIELVVDEGADDGLYGATKPSLRKDNILEDGDNDSTATPLPYTALYSSDALFRVRVWRTIDTRTQKTRFIFTIRI